MLTSLLFLLTSMELNAHFYFEHQTSIYKISANCSLDTEKFKKITFSISDINHKRLTVNEAALVPWDNYYWLFIVAIILISFLLLGIRKFEKNRQLIRFNFEKNQFMEGLFQNAPFAVAATDIDGRLTTINEMFEVIFEYSKNEVIGKKIDEFLLYDELDSTNTNSNFVQLEEHQKVYKVCKRRSKSGKLIDVELFTTPNFIAGKQNGHLLFYNDITKRLEIETELEKTFSTHRQVLDTLQDAYFEANPKGIITYCNNALAKAMGYRSKEEIIGKHFRKFVSRKNIRDFLENFKLLYNKKKPIDSFDVDYITKEGITFTSEIVASPILEDDEVVGARGIIRDISLRVKAESILREAKNAAEYRINELSSINYVAEKISHSLNLEDILNSACRELTKVFPVRSAGISLLNKDQTALEIMAFQTHDDSEEKINNNLLRIDDNEDVKRMLSLKKTVLVNNAQIDPRTRPIHELAKKNGTKSFMIVPLINRGKIIGTIGMPAKDHEYVFSANEIELAETIASQIAAAIENARLHAQTELALDIVKQDLEIGKQIQSGFFPKSLPKIQGWDIAAYFNPARQVSGDFYDIFRIKDTKFYLFVVADVCDKGVGAALFMVLLRSLIRSYSEQSERIDTASKVIYEIAQKVNNYIIALHSQSNMFATLVLAILDSSKDVLHYINGGHEAPVLIADNGKIKLHLESTGPAFGFSSEIPFEVNKVKFSDGDILITYTDGLTEAKDSSGEFYSYERLSNKTCRKWDSAFSLIKAIEYDVIHHIGDQKQFDDITMVALQKKNIAEAQYHTIIESADLEKLAILKNFLVDTCETFKVEKEITEKLKLAVDEICTNIISYGYENLDQGEISLSIGIKEDIIEVEIIDSGHPFDSSAVEAPELSSDIFERNIGGLGLFFVRETIDDIKYSRENGRNRLILIMNKSLITEE